MDFIKKYNKVIGITGCILTMIAYTILLCIGTNVMRVEFNFVVHALFPVLISKVFIFLWCMYHAFSKDYDLGTRIYAKNLLIVIIVNMIITALDTEMNYFFLVQSLTSLLMIVLMVIIINQRRFAIRSKKYSAKIYVINIFLCICIAGFTVLTFTSFKNQYVILFVGTIAANIMLMIAMYVVDDVEKKFQRALKAGTNDLKEEDYSD